MDRIALLLYVSRVERQALGLAAEAHATASFIRDAELVDEAMLLRRAGIIDGLVEMRRDDLRLLRHPRLLGRWCIAGAAWLLRLARALR